MKWTVFAQRYRAGTVWARQVGAAWAPAFWGLVLSVCLAACGGGGGSGGMTPPVSGGSGGSGGTGNAALEVGNSTQHATVLHAVPTDADGGGSAGGSGTTTLTVHYRRADGQYSGWQLHTWGAAQDPGWNQGWNAQGSDSFGAVYQVPLTATSGSVGYLFHKGDTKDHGGVDQAWTLQAGANEIWRIEGDAVTYTSNPLGSDPSVAGVSNLKQARAVWLNRQLVQWPAAPRHLNTKLYWSATGAIKARLDTAVSGHDGVLSLEAFSGAVPSAVATRFKWVGSGAVFAVKSNDLGQLGQLHKMQLVLVQEDGAGKVRNATLTQVPGALDDLYAAAAQVPDLGVSVSAGTTGFKLWAPTAQKVSVFTYGSSTGAAQTVDEMSFDAQTGVWSASRSGDLSGQYYRYAVEVFVRGVGVVRNLVTDPYSISLNTQSQRSYIAQLDSAALKPAGWDASTPPAKVSGPTDLMIYELHVRDFSAQDNTVSAANRGKYLAFTEGSSNGMRHLKMLADAGMTDVHLLPTFDIASVPEQGCVTPSPNGASDSESQQATVAATASTDCFNWGYDPWHFTAPEGSYASSADDGARRILEFRAMVMALHAAGLRVGMDVVYNHTTASGQNAKSVLDRIVPGYYHRLDAVGAVTTSTCCDNTATENLMMGKLMSDSLLVWARDYKISSFRFDIMGHQPRSVMEEIKARLKTAVGRDIHLIGEGWNFGEVADGARFVQASMFSLNGSGIGTFNPYARDAVRGGSPFDSGSSLVARQGFINGLFFDPNAQAGTQTLADLRWQGDIIRAGLAGSVRPFVLPTHQGVARRLDEVWVYPGQSAGYVSQPSEVVNYVENHDNQTLFDINAMKLPSGTSRQDRARVQILGAAITAFSQGIAYYHAGIETLRSKSLDRNSYDAGDWFNRLDWTYSDNNFGVGLPMSADNGNSWSTMRPILSNSSIKPTAAEIAWTRDAFRDLLRIRASTTLLRLRTTEDIVQRLSFPNSGPEQVSTVLMGRVDGSGYPAAQFKELVYLINVDTVERVVTVAALQGKSLVLHPVHTRADAADTRAREATFSAGSGSFKVPARTAVVFVGL